MKKVISILLVFVALFSGCRYEEGPGISFYSPKKRLVGYWKLDKLSKNGTPTASEAYQADKVGNYYAFYDNGMLSVTTVTSAGQVRDSHSGSWEFDGKKKNKLNVDFSLLNRHYKYTADIVKLSRQELRYEYVDENGDTWKLEMSNRSNY